MEIYASKRSIPYEDGSLVDKCFQILKNRSDSLEKNKNNLVIATSKGGYLTQNNYNKTVKNVIRNACGDEVAKGMSSHKLRHTFISLLVNDGNRDLATIASIVGHSDIGVTLRYAGHTNDTKKKETLRSIISCDNIVFNKVKKKF